MTDQALELLQDFIQDIDKSTLCVADENLLVGIEQLKQHPQLSLISNRWDVTQRAQQAGLDCNFSDMDFSHVTSASIDQLVYRVSKERPLVNHVIREAFRVLKNGGQLHLAGEKGDGIKTYIEKGSKFFGQKVPARKHGSFYVASIEKKTNDADAKCLKALDDKDYPNLRVMGEINGKDFYSKPGQFGWSKFDRGSELLIEVADQYLQSRKSQPQSLLDLGCGYGYLTLNSYRWASIETRTATDNNAAALLSIQKNAEQQAHPVTVIADDCGASINDTFDLILCNPPFHQGFDVEGDLTTEFLKRIRSALAKGGVALVVVNMFIPVERKAVDLFNKKKIEVVEDNGAFKVVALHG